MQQDWDKAMNQEEQTLTDSEKRELDMGKQMESAPNQADIADWSEDLIGVNWGGEEAVIADTSEASSQEPEEKKARKYSETSTGRSSRDGGTHEGYRLTDILPSNAIEAGINASSRSLSGRIGRLRRVAGMSKEANRVFGEMVAKAMRQEAEVQGQRRELLMMQAKQANYALYRDATAAYAEANATALLQVLETIADNIVEGMVALFERAQMQRERFEKLLADGAIGEAHRARLEAAIERMEAEAVAALETWERRTREQFDRTERHALRSSADYAPAPELE